MTRLGAAALVLLVSLAGCRDQRHPGKVVIRVANWGGAKEGNDYDTLVENIYKEFERENPGIEVKEESMPGEYVSKVTLAYIAGDEPDILMLDLSSSALFINNRMVADLKPLIDKDKSFSLDDFYPNVVNAARRGDGIYAIPQDFTPMVVYYNKKMFDRARVPYPKSDWNFARFRETAKKVTVSDDKPGDVPRQYGFAFTNWMAGWVMWLWNNGSDHVAPDGAHVSGYLDSRKSVEAVSFLRDLIETDKVAPSLSQAAATGVDPFANGQAAMAVSGHWSMVGYKAAPMGPDGKPTITWEDLGVVAMPHNTPQSQTVYYEAGYAIGAHSKHKDAAWKFIRYMTCNKVQRMYQSSGIAICARKDVAEERAKASPLEAEFMPIIPTARPPYGSRIEGYDYVETQGVAAMDSILQQHTDPQVALTRAAKKIDREFLKK